MIQLDESIKNTVSSQSDISRLYTAPAPSNRNSKDYASSMRAWLHRQNYNDYQNRFQPHEQELLDAVMGRELLDERLSAISINESNAFDATKETTSRRLQRFGVSENSGLSKSRNLGNSLTQASSVASAHNNTRQHVHDRSMQLISGAPSSRSAIQDL